MVAALLSGQLDVIMGRALSLDQVVQLPDDGPQRAQPPCTQTSPDLHALPHMPQLFGSRLSAKQSVPHCE